YQAQAGGQGGGGRAEQDGRHLDQGFGQGIAVAEGALDHGREGGQGRLPDHQEEDRSEDEESERGGGHGKPGRCAPTFEGGGQGRGRRPLHRRPRGGRDGLPAPQRGT